MTAAERFLHAGGLRFRVAEEGPAGGPLVLLLHGFPERPFSFARQMAHLASRGFRAVAPDLRGHHPTDQPRGVAAYDLDRLADDVVALVGALGRERAALVGHDWGGAIAWHTAATHPERVTHLCALACPPPAVLARAIVSSPRQLWRSRYMLFFQLPWLPERWLRARGVAWALRRWSARPHVFSTEEIARYVAAARTPGTMTAAVHYYRAAIRRAPRMLREPARRVSAPTLVVWGRHDGALGAELTAGLDRHVVDPARLRVVILEQAGHFLMQEAPDEVNRLLAEHLGGGAGHTA